MRGLLVAACLVTGIAQAQVPTLLMPNPLGIAITIGQWIYRGGEKVYYIEVVGQGATLEQARQNGFRLAVEEAIGSLVASEAEVQNGRLARDEIINYSAGYVSKFQLIREETGPLGNKVTMQVWVKRSALADRLLNESKKSGEIEGATAAVSFQTINQERQTGDRLLGTVLNDFPRRAFDITIGASRVTFGSDRKARLEIPVTINYNKHYLNSLWAALDATQNSGARYCEITVANSGTATYGDKVKFDMVASAMIYSNPSIRVDLISSQNQVIRTVYWQVPIQVQQGMRTQKWFSLGIAPFQMEINNNPGYTTVVIEDIDSAILTQINRVNMAVATNKNVLGSN